MFAPLVLAAALALPARAARLGIDAPPGWNDVTDPKNDGVVISLKGPETSSFVLAKVDPMSLDNRGATRAFLIDVLSSVNQKTGLGFTLSSNLNITNYDNGVALYSINADYQGKPRLVLGLMQSGPDTLLATLISAVPDTLLPSIMGAIKNAETPAGAPGAQAATGDNQIAFELPAGLTTRPVTESERKMGFVLAIQGLGSELMIMKLVDDTTPVKDQPAVVKDTVLSVAGIDKNSVSDVSLLTTPAGPELVYATGRVKDGAGGSAEFAAGYVPWCYWGYSVLSKGPKATQLMTQVFSHAQLGSSALPKLVSETPKIPLTEEVTLRGQEVPLLPLAAGAAALLVLLAVFLATRRRR